MLRPSVIIVATTFVAALLIPFSSAEGKPPMPSGSLTCTVEGRFMFNPPLRSTPAQRPVAVRTVARSTSCDNSGVVGGKVPTTEVQLRGLRYFLPSATCATVLTDVGRRLDVNIIYRGRNTKNQRVYVASVKTPLLSTVLSPPSWDFVYDAAPADGPFPGAPIGLFTTIQTQLAGPQCDTKKGVRVVEFTGTFEVGTF